MATVRVNGIEVYYEAVGSGFPLVWAHEWGGSSASWDPQVKFFSRYCRVVTYNARGYSPSEVPATPESYSQETAVDDLHGLLRHLDIEEAYLGGLSMGGSTALNFAIAHPEMTKALVIASSGAGSTGREQFEKDILAMAATLESRGVEALAETFTHGPTRVQLKRKDPRSWQEFYDDFLGHSPVGLSHCLRRIVLGRKTVYQLESELRTLQVPILILVGDEDEPCIEPGIFMKRNIPGSGLVVFPQSGHLLNLEEPQLFNRTILDFLVSVDRGNWVRQRNA